MTFVADWIAFHADRTPNRPALQDQGSGRCLTYAELNERSGRLATFMRTAWGVGRGDRVAVLARNSAAYFELQWACFKLGAMLLPLNWRLAVPELAFIVDDCRPVALIFDTFFTAAATALRQQVDIPHTLPLDLDVVEPGYEDAIAAAAAPTAMPADLNHDDPAIIMYTSGTSGRPKGALITHGMMFWNAINIAVPTGLNRDSVQYQVLPTFHIAGLNLYVNPLLHFGGMAIIAREFDPGLTLRTLADADLGVTHFFGVPANYLFMSQHETFAAADLSHVQSWGCGGSPMPVALLKQYAERGIIVQLGFGMTETSPTVFLIARDRALRKPDSVGKPLPHTRVRVVREDFSDVAPGEVGEVVISGPNVTPGYWNRPEATAESFTLDAIGQRWLHSGDAGTVDEEGCIYIVDRYKDMYISGGENVYPAEVEQVIFSVAGVADVAVIGVPDTRWGESGLAVVVRAPDATVSDEGILDACRANLARFKVPKAVAYIDALPRNAAGKVLKRVLREQFS